VYKYASFAIGAKVFEVEFEAGFRLVSGVEMCLLS